MNQQPPSGHRLLASKEDFDQFLFSTPLFVFLDIMGFKNLVENNSHEQLVHIYDELFTRSINTTKEMFAKFAMDRKEKNLLRM